MSEFKGKHYVNVREMYEKDGKLLPTPKGLSMNEQAWSALADAAAGFTAALPAS